MIPASLPTAYKRMDGVWKNWACNILPHLTFVYFIDPVIPVLGNPIRINVVSWLTRVERSQKLL